MLVIIALVIFWYGLVPIAGAFISRRAWRIFRRRFGGLLRKPPLDYRSYRRTESSGEGVFRFTGGFESLSGDHTLWLRGGDLTIPVALEGAHAYAIPSVEGPSPAQGGAFGGFFIPGDEAPERVRWNRISSMAAGAKVFVGGSLALREGRRIFVSTRENPLLVIFYDGPDFSFPARTIQAGRRRNEYWNTVTPYSLILGGFSLLLMVLTFLPRPAFRLTALTALIALFTPLFPLIPPGLLFTILYRQLWGRARVFRACRDMARLPLEYLSPGEWTGLIPGEGRYGAIRLEALPPAFFDRKIPLLIPEEVRPAFHKREGWYVFGILSESQVPPKTGDVFPPEKLLPAGPRDPLIVYGAVPGRPEALAVRYTIHAYILEVIAWLVLLGGMGFNGFFIWVILSLL